MSTALTEYETSGDQPRNALTEINSSRAGQEVQAAMIVAKKFPRDETQALVKIRNACKRRRLAEAAVYSYPRGGTQVEGPSIRLAECMAQNWGNLDFGVVELEQKFGESTCMAYCWDLETNTRQTKIFQVKHLRHTRNGATHLKDPRDIYEMVANQGARRVRACILGVIPGDIVDEALEEVNATLRNADGGKPLKDRVRAMAVAFDGLGVAKELLEKRLGHSLDATTEAELVSLRKIYTSIKDGMSTREDWFQFDDPAQTSKGGKATKRDAKDVLGPESAAEAREPEQGDPSSLFTGDAPDIAPPSFFEQFSNELRDADDDDTRRQIGDVIAKSKKITDEERAELLKMVPSKGKK